MFSIFSDFLIWVVYWHWKLVLWVYNSLNYYTYNKEKHSFCGFKITILLLGQLCSQQCTTNASIKLNCKEKLKVYNLFTIEKRRGLISTSISNVYIRKLYYCRGKSFNTSFQFRSETMYFCFNCYALINTLL